MALSSLSSPSIPSCPSSLVSSSSLEIASLSRDKIQAEILAITGAASLAQVNSSYPAIPVRVVSPGSPPPMLVSESRPISWAAVTQGSSKPLTFHPPVLEDGKLKVKLPRTVRDERVKLWEDCLIGTFIATVHCEQPIAELKSCKDGHNTFEVLANIDDEKLKALKASFRQLNKNSYGDLHERLIKETKKLHAIQIDLLSNSQEDLVIIEQEQAKRVADLTFAEEAFLKQKSRVHWLKEGDQNTTYFHKILKIRRCKNSIRELHSDDGKVLTQHADIAREAIAFYQKLLGTEDPSCLGGELELLKTLFNFQLPNTMQQALIQPVTAEECK
ncbi:hypothetical protein SLEP1_g4891 [Rubroshorea leprosula]|uniref:Uncharacterized protein n=1 Tax=Rubroshorea leprosula TaxID=152421 RepID=A0AAV5HQ74_9ROSI|nr:hypothetical protein SLEP1_g4891 [Rubroshorea leprosula]